MWTKASILVKCIPVIHLLNTVKDTNPGGHIQRYVWLPQKDPTLDMLSKLCRIYNQVTKNRKANFHGDIFGDTWVNNVKTSGLMLETVGRLTQSEVEETVNDVIRFITTYINNIDKNWIRTQTQDSIVLENKDITNAVVLRMIYWDLYNNELIDVKETDRTRIIIPNENWKIFESHSDLIFK